MRSEFQAKQELVIDGKKFTVDKKIGEGSSCIVYQASYEDTNGSRRIYRLKQLYPENARIHIGADAASLVWDLRKERPEWFMYFRKAETFWEELQNREGMYKYIFPSHICEAYGTLISVTEITNVVSVMQIPDTDIGRIIHMAHLLADIMVEVHKAGYLHLDICPENLMVSVVTGSLRLFTMDSLVPLKDMKKYFCPRKSPYVPGEVRKAHLTEVGAGSDVYSIGAMLYKNLYGKMPKADIHGSSEKDSAWALRKDQLEYVDPVIEKLLAEIFRKTLDSSVNNRYRNMAELSRALGEAEEIAKAGKPELVSDPISSVQEFCGRSAQLKQINDFFTETTGNRILFLYGPEGMGKSELARHYAVEYENRYDKQIFVRFERSTPVTWITENNRFREEGWQTEESIQDVLRRIPIRNCHIKKDELLFTMLQNRKILLIVDQYNVGAFEDPGLEVFLRKMHETNVHVIITTTTDFTAIASKDPKCRLMEVNRMAYDVLRRLFWRYACQENSNTKQTKALDELVTKVGSNTYCVACLGARMRTRKYASVEQLRTEFVETMRHIVPEDRSSYDTEDVIKALFSMAQMDAAKKQVLRNMAVLSDQTPQQARYMALCGNNIAETEALKALMNLQILQNKSDRLFLHSTIEEIVWRDEQPTAKNCAVLFSHLRNIGSEKIDYRNFESSAAKVVLLRKTGEYEVAAALGLKLIAYANNEWGEDSPEAMAYLEDRARDLRLQQKFVEAEKLDRVVFDRRSALLGAEDLKTLSSQTALAHDLFGQGRTEEAQRMDFGIYEKYRRQLGAEHPFTLSAQANMACDLISQGLYDDAETHDGAILDIRRRILGEKHYFTLVAQYNLGMDLLLKDQVEKAESIHKALYNTLKLQYAKDNLFILSVLFALATELTAKGQYIEAEKMSRDVYDGRCRILGEENPDTLMALHCVAQTLRLQGRYRDAARMDQKIYEHFCEVLDDGSSILQSIRLSLAEDSRREGRYAEAQELDQKVYDRNVRTLGENHPQTIESLRALAADMRKQQQYQDAEKYDRKVYTYYLEHESDNPMKMTQIRAALVEDLNEKGSYREAEKLLREILHYTEDDKPDTAMVSYDGDRVYSGNDRVYSGNGRVYSGNDRVYNGNDQEDDDDERFEDMDENDIYDIERIPDRENPQTLAVMNLLADVLQNQGKYYKAEELHRDVYELRAAVLGEEDPDTLTTKNSLGTDRYYRGRYADALETHRQVFEKRLRVLGENHRDTLVSIRSMGIDYNRLPDYNRADEYLRWALQLQKESFGDTDPDTLITKRWLAYNLARQEKDAEAVQMCTEVYEIHRQKLGELHPETLQDQYMLGRIFYQRYGFKRTDSYYWAVKNQFQQVLDQSLKVFEEDSPMPLIANHFLVTMGMHRNNILEYKGRLESVYRGCRKLFGKESPECLECVNKLLYCYVESEEYDKVVKMVRENYSFFLRSYGEYSLNVECVLKNLRYAYAQMGNFRKAKEIHRQVRAIQKHNKKEKKKGPPYCKRHGKVIEDDYQALLKQ